MSDLMSHGWLPFITWSVVTVAVIVVLGECTHRFMCRVPRPPEANQ